MNVTKISKASKLICAAALPALAAMMPSKASAAIVVTATAQTGVAHDSFGDTAAGYTGYLITVSVDTGDIVAAVDMGSAANSPNGIFGTLLQDWATATKKGVTTFTPTPVGSTANDTNGSSTGTDSHLLILGANRADVTSPFEDNPNATTPVPPSPVGAPPQDASDTWGNGTYLHGVFGVSGGSNTMNLAYVVMPTGSKGSFQIDVSEIPAAGGATSDKVVTGSIGSGGSPIISLTATSAAGVSQAAFVGVDNPNSPTAGAINVVSTGTGFVRGELNGIAAGVGSKAGVTEVKFENAAGTAVDPGIEYIGLNVADGLNGQGSTQFNSDIDALIADINSATLGLGANSAYSLRSGGTITNAPAAEQIAALGLNAGKSGAAQYDIIVGVPTSAATGLGDSFLGLNLANDAALPAGLEVTDIAAVPEPATAAGLLIGASGLLLGRRKRKA